VNLEPFVFVTNCDASGAATIDYDSYGAGVSFAR
jgi:hypothetical protein